MKHVFAGGSRKVTRLNAEIRERLGNMIEKQLAVFVGDANGADKAIQTYLSERRYPNVLVFCTGGECRNNLGGWPVRAVKAPHSSRDFAFFTAKDAAMASEAEVGFMLWDGQSSGTMVNVARMVSSAKPVVLYISPQRTFTTLKSRQDLENLIQGVRDDVAQKVRRYIAEHAREFRVASTPDSASVTPPETSGAWEELFRLGDALDASDTPGTDTLTATVLAMRR